MPASRATSSQRRTYAIPFSYRVTTTSVSFGTSVPSSLRAPAVRRVPCCEYTISQVPPERMPLTTRASTPTMS